MVVVSIVLLLSMCYIVNLHFKSFLAAAVHCASLRPRCMCLSGSISSFHVRVCSFVTPVMLTLTNKLLDIL